MARTYLKSDLFHHVLKTCERFTFIQNIERSNENNIKFDQGDDEKETDTKKAGRDLLEALKADRFSENQLKKLSIVIYNGGDEGDTE